MAKKFDLNGKMRQKTQSFIGFFDERPQNRDRSSCVCVVIICLNIKSTEMEEFPQKEAEETPLTDDEEELIIIKRDGRRQKFELQKPVRRLVRMSRDLCPQYVDQPQVVENVKQLVPEEIYAAEFDLLLAKYSAKLSSHHPDYNMLGGRVAVSILHKETSDSFSAMIEELYNGIDSKTGKPRRLITDEYYKIVQSNASELDAMVDYDRDYNFTYISYKILEQNYLVRIDDKVIERPQHMFMRVAVAINKNDMDGIKETYRLLSEKYYIHGSPTLFYAMFNRQQMGSSFTITLHDHLEDIFKRLNHCEAISKLTGNVSIDIQNMRAIRSPIPGVAGISNGLVPLIRILNRTYNNIKGSPKRPGGFAIYIEPWHAEVFEFLQLSRLDLVERETAPDLFYIMWVPDLLLKRVDRGNAWSLMDPFQSPGLTDCWGEEFERLYINYEAENKRTRQVSALGLWYEIIESQVKSGMPYILYKDTCNRKSNVKHLGTIRAGGFCTDILPYTSQSDVGGCCYASINLRRAVVVENLVNMDELKNITRTVTRNLNRMIDVNFYPVPSARKNAHLHRPIALGVQGLADVFTKMQIDMESSLGRLINKQIFETIYFAALEESCELAKKYGPYSSYRNSPISKGILQFDMWNVKPSDLWNWAELKDKIAKYGVRNSLLIALMPTRTTSQILGSNETVDPLFANLYKVFVSGDCYDLLNRDLVKELTKLELWSEDLRQQIVSGRGSIQEIEDIPQHIRKAFKNAWEIPISAQIKLAKDRGPFVDQSQALNLYLSELELKHLRNIHYSTWKSGLKTGLYHLMVKPFHTPMKYIDDKSAFEDLDTVPIDLSTLASSSSCR